MKCINCGKNMTTVEAGGVVVDVCNEGCGGMWFDMLELKRFDEPHEGAGEELLRLEPPYPVQIQHDRRLNCPRCADVVLMRFFFSPRRRVEVEHCPNCGGHWLDAGELRLIRDEALSEAAREAEIEAVLNREFGAQLYAMAAERAEAMERPPILRRMLGFLVPHTAQPQEDPSGVERRL
jgi:Zn-finger nucleic acid-binding protein